MDSFTQRLLESLGYVRYEPSCVVEEDSSEVVRHAEPLNDRSRAALREQRIAQMKRDDHAIAQREARITGNTKILRYRRRIS